ncbi:MULTISPECIES: PhzF family phenazine biosynthesis protein [Kordiimonas]|uniref:PhzF family phenazine biosynthesis protein n=1 Tax=Kordiimonas TaxID=288021 RepID=UPI00257E7389|nr:PhzF family phenazine biosynthesis protein [Kordiimonas sp. UBA4487]
MKQSNEKSSITAHIVNGFVQNGAGGNPAGVVLDADGLSDAQMLAVAKNIGASETAFVSRSATEGFKLDFFTPNRRIAHCGHATIATFSYLAEIGRVPEGVTSKETVDGPRKIIIEGGAAFMEQLAPRYSSAPDWQAAGISEADVLASLGLAADDLDPRALPTLVNTGNSFMVVGVKTGETLRALTPDLKAIERISDALDLIGYYVFTTDHAATSKHATTRMFAPRYAIDEEAATGMAAGPLACLLFDRLDAKTQRLEIEQGHFMTPTSPSLITVDLSVTDGRITGLMAGGYGKSMKTLQVEI